MTLVTLPYRTSLAGGQPEVIAQILADFDAILAVINGDLRNDNVSSAAGIAIPKLAISGSPTGAKFLRDDGSWQVPPGVAPIVPYKKVTTKDVVNTTTKTDLLNAEITIGASVMGANSVLVADLGGDYLNSTGSSKTIDLELKLGTTVLWDGGVSDVLSSAADRRAWRLLLYLQAMNSTAVQLGHGSFGIGSNNAATTGTGALSAPSGVMGAVPLGTVSSAENMTLAKALTFSVTHSAANASLSMRLLRAAIHIYV
jgi:hypothetical protein